MAYFPPLDPNEQQIRLLILTSTVSEEALKCSLRSVSPTSNPKYTALSYVWGDEAIRSPISINGEMTSITASLDIALRNLWRKEGEEVWVWADAICINQADDVEKAWQVQMMGGVYSNAIETWIWLGESADNSDLAMDLVRRIGDIDFEDPDLVLDPVAWSAFWSLMRRPWWKRMWVLQETFLAKKAMVNCGQTGVSIECFIHLQEIKTKYRRSTEPRLRLVQCVPAAPFFVFLSDWDRFKASFADGGIWLSQLLSVTGGFDSKLKRDKIFALLGMSRDLDRQMIHVDYEGKEYIADVQLNIRIAVYHLTRDREHNCLHHLQMNQESKSVALPSWVPDYTIDDPIGHFMFPYTERSRSYSAAADNSAWAAISRASLAPNLNPELNSVMPRFKTDPYGAVLILPGLVVDTIFLSHPTPTVLFYQDRDLEKTGGFDLGEDDRIKSIRRKLTTDICKIWEQLAIDLFKEDVDPYKNKPGGRYEAFWRTLIADRESNWEGPPTAERDFGGRFDAWKRGSADEAYVRPYSDAAILRCMQRSFFISEKGYLGLGPSHTHAGDVVCGLKGGNVPFVLRQTHEACYGLIGESYVHGIMDGSCVRKARPEDLQEIWIR